MPVNNVTNSTSTTQTQTNSSASSTRNTGAMGKDEFLQLLSAQLKYQDPLNPMDDKEFVSQMAQFSSLEQMQNLNTSFSSMKALSLMGKSISATIKNAETGESSQVNGTVGRVKMASGKAYVDVNGKEVAIDDISEVSDYGSSKFTDLMPLIGKTVDGAIADEQGGVIGVSGKVTGVKNNGGTNFVALDQVQLSDTDVVLPDGEIAYKDDYLNSNINKEITVEVTDANGYKTNVTAKLLGWTKGQNGYDVTLSGVMVPVDNLGGISQ